MTNGRATTKRTLTQATTNRVLYWIRSLGPLAEVSSTARQAGRGSDLGRFADAADVGVDADGRDPFVVVLALALLVASLLAALGRLD